jgi:hypothetical protein
MHEIIAVAAAASSTDIASNSSVLRQNIRFFAAWIREHPGRSEAALSGGSELA